jgi:hypothetical protein
MIKPLFPVWRREFYLDALTNGKRYIPRPAWREEFYLAKLAGYNVPVPKAVTLREIYYESMLVITETAPEYKPEYPKIYAFLARAAGQDVQLPRAETREQRYWLEYIQQKGL